MPRTPLERLADSLRECKTLLEQVQPVLQGPGWLPPIEVVRADEVLGELAARPASPGHFASILTRLELFAEEFGRLARSPEQLRLAAGFNEFVGGLGRSFDAKGMEEPAGERKAGETC